MFVLLSVYKYRQPEYAKKIKSGPEIYLIAFVVLHCGMLKILSYPEPSILSSQTNKDPKSSKITISAHTPIL